MSLYTGVGAHTYRDFNVSDQAPGPMIAKDLFAQQQSQEQDDEAGDRGRESYVADLEKAIDAVACSQHREDASRNRKPCPH